MIVLSWRDFIHQTILQYGWLTAFFFLIMRGVVVIIGLLGSLTAFLNVVVLKKTMNSSLNWYHVLRIRLLETLGISQK